MTKDETVRNLRRLKVQTGSLACLGCRQEHKQKGLLDAMEKAAKHYKEQRDAAVKQLRRIADCDTCRHNQPCGVDSPKCVACTRGQAWEWDGGE